MKIITIKNLIAVLIIAFITMSGGFVLSVFATNTDGVIDANNRYAWSENAGWIDFGISQGNVLVMDDVLTGYAWGENLGWISLNCSNNNTCASVVNYKVANDGAGNLSGYAWSENAGWIDFAPAQGGVSINSSGEFSGYAWGENIGWIVFNCATTNSCDGVNYKVKTDWRPASLRPSGALWVPPTTQESIAPTTSIPTASAPATTSTTTPATTSTPTNNVPVVLAQGSLIKFSDSDKVYVLINNQRFWIPNAQAFTAAGYQWNNIQTISSADLDIQPLANLIKTANDPAVYVLTNNQRRHIPNPETFTDYGYNWNNIITVTPAELDGYIPAVLLKTTNNPAVYYLSNNQRRYIASAAVFNQHNWQWNDIIEVSQLELEYYSEGAAVTE